MALRPNGIPDRVVDAAQAAEIVVLAVPTKAVAVLPKGLFADLPSNAVVIDIANYHPELRDGRIDAIDGGMLDSQWVAQQIGHPVIKAYRSEQEARIRGSLKRADGGEATKGTKGRSPERGGDDDGPGRRSAAASAAAGAGGDQSRSALLRR